MDNNDVLRRLRYALDISDTHMLDIFALAGTAPPRATFLAMLVAETEPDHVSLTDRGLGQFLDGLIHERRGPPDPSRPPPKTTRMDNNMVLRKLKIAFAYTTDDMIRVLQGGGMVVSGTELTALFRKVGHKHYRPAGDQILRSFLVGLAEEFRSDRGRPTEHR